MVYDGTASGLNNALWASNFGLPTVDSASRATNMETWMEDLDLGENVSKLHGRPSDPTLLWGGLDTLLRGLKCRGSWAGSLGKVGAVLDGI